MSITNLQKIMRAALFTPTRSGWGLPLLFWGPPGVGKSDIIEGVAASHGFPCEVLSPGERGEGAFGVTPMPDADGYISYPPPRWSAQFTSEAGGLVFLDEINTAPPAIQAAMMGLLLKRRIGGSVLDGRTRMMGAANDVADSAGGWDLAPPVANRLGHLPWEAPSESEWTDWLMASDEGVQSSTPAEQQEKAVMAAWNESWSRQRGLVAGFIRSKPDALHKQPPTGSPEASKAWPSHRSWEFATRALASAKVNGLTEADGDMFAAAFVGSGIIGELITYRAAADLPDPTALLDGRIKWKPDFKRLDRTYAVLGSTTSIMMGDVDAAGTAAKAKKDARVMKRFDVYVELLAATAAGAKDLTWNAAKAMAKKGMHDATDESRKIMRQLLPIVNAVEGK
jgi:MoxR-like ATPase